jgi:hypothetical protein
MRPAPSGWRPEPGLQLRDRLALGLRFSLRNAKLALTLILANETIAHLIAGVNCPVQTRS